MRARLGTIKGKRIDVNRDGDSDVRLLDAEISSTEDVQTVELINNSGEDFTPENEDVVLVLSLGDAYKLGLIIDDQVAPDPSILDGEKELYSKAGGSKLAKIKLNQDSEVVLNDGPDYAVLFSELKSQIDQLRTALNAHTHTGVTAGGGVTGAPVTPFTVNVDGTKVEKVRL